MPSIQQTGSGAIGKGYRSTMPGVGTPFIPGAPPSPLQPDIIRDTIPSSDIVQRFTLVGGLWTEFPIDRPSIIYCVLPMDIGLQQFPLFYYNYGRKPVVPPFVAGTVFYNAQFCSHNGIAFLSSPGNWWITPRSSTASMDVLQIDATNPGVQAKYLSLGGTNVLSQANIAVASQVAVTLLASANRGRQALTLQNTGGANVKVSVSQPASYLQAVGPGLLLTPGSSITYQGDTLLHGTAYAIATTATATTVESVEYADYNT